MLSSPQEVTKIIRNLKPYKAPGEDGIQGNTLKNMSRRMLTQIYYIIKECQRKQTFPEIWKNAPIISVKKPKKLPNRTAPSHCYPYWARCIKEWCTNK